jgi:DNA primase
MFYITDIVRDIRIAIEDLYFNLEEAERNNVAYTDLEPMLSEDQRHFYESKVKYKFIDLSDQEYLDFKDVLNNYLTTIQIEKWNEEIAVAPTIEEKIKLAEYRDLKLKEDKKWIKRK